MDAFLVFIRKLLSCCGACTEEEERSKISKVRFQRNPSDQCSSDLSSQLASRCNFYARSDNDLQNKSWFSDTSNSSSVRTQRSSLEILTGANYSYDSSKKKLTDIASMKITECVSRHQNEQLTVELSKSLHSDRPSSEARPGSQLQGSSGNSHLLGPQKTRLVPQKLTSESSIVIEPKVIKKLLVPKEKSSCKDHLISNVSIDQVERKIQGYCSSHKILLVGEGDFSFSACLAKAFGSAENMIATSLNSKEYLMRYYSNAMINISYLKTRGCQVLHEVNATDLSSHTSITGLSFDRIVYNFPHCGDFSGTAASRRKNQNLVRGFMKQSAKLIKEDGEIHIRHKSNHFFQSWDLRKLASKAGLVLVDEAPFNPALFSGYNTKYGFEGGRFCSDYNFDCHPSCTYKFVLINGSNLQKR